MHNIIHTSCGVHYNNIIPQVLSSVTSLAPCHNLLHYLCVPLLLCALLWCYAVRDWPTAVKPSVLSAVNRYTVRFRGNDDSVSAPQLQGRRREFVRPVLFRRAAAASGRRAFLAPMSVSRGFPVQKQPLPPPDGP